MKQLIPEYASISPEVNQARHLRAPIVALETTVITHGLPNPHNVNLALEMEQIIRSVGAIPATIGILKGKILIGMTEDQIRALAQEKDVRKISSRDIAPAIAARASGGTTVAGTLVVAHQAGIRVFATGGIGGVHRNTPFDLSADLPELARRPVLVVCAGAKAILDLSATTEYLETISVPVLGYQTDIFPAFYSRESELLVSQRVESVQQAAMIAKLHWQIGLTSSVLVTVPPPEDVALPYGDIKTVIDQALSDAKDLGIKGQDVTPFLLSRISDLSDKTSLTANLGLLLNNARIAAEIAKSLLEDRDTRNA